jgi:hypothetical protein
MASKISRSRRAASRSRVTRPAFTAESALGRSSASYVRLGAGTGSYIHGISPAQVTVSGVSGIYAGTYCASGVLCVLTIDVDEYGHVVNSHCADEIGSC